MKIPEKYRIQHPSSLYTPTKEGDPYGFFKIPYAIKLGGNMEKKIILFCLASSGDEEIPWEHVSISVLSTSSHPVPRCPTWEEMCHVKNLFWESSDNVIQFHPPESEYVSQHKYVLHLWKKHGENWETPPSIAIGYKKGQDI